MDSEKIGTIMLVLKNIMDSLKPILYSNVLYIHQDMNESNSWNPFHKQRIYQLAIDLNLIESDQEREQKELEEQARAELADASAAAKDGENTKGNGSSKDNSESNKEKEKEKEKENKKENSRFSQTRSKTESKKDIKLKKTAHHIHKYNSPSKQRYKRLMIDMYKEQLI